jgi:hypothetical protein
MTKKVMAVKIASALLNVQVDETNWKVKDLMKRTTADLKSHMYLTEKILTGDSKWNSGY